ncbi:MAG: hypothetical protein ABF326_08125 [Arenicellales bacterium]|jgi:hypothetical protein
MSKEYLMTGSFGLDVDAWQGSFYDDDLPVDWRAASYSILLRSVLLPQSEWRQAAKNNWINEVDEGFRFILYAISEAETDLHNLIEELTGLPAAFSAQVAGLVLKYDWQNAGEEVSKTILELNKMFPVCLDAGTADYATSGVDMFCHKVQLSSVWYPEAQKAPLPSGEFLIVLIDQQTLPEQRKIVSEIDRWMSGERSAGLFNTSKDDAPVRAQETRILAELMGV